MRFRSSMQQAFSLQAGFPHLAPRSLVDANPPPAKLIVSRMHRRVVYHRKRVGRRARVYTKNGMAQASPHPYASGVHAMRGPTRLYPAEGGLVEDPILFH